MTLTDDAVALVERAYSLVARYEETRDAALLGDNNDCVQWLRDATAVLAAKREADATPAEETPAEEAMTVDQLAENIAIGVHTGLRKGSEAPSSATLWRAINVSDDGAWGEAALFCAEGLTSMGYVVVKR